LGATDGELRRYFPKQVIQRGLGVSHKLQSISFLVERLMFSQQISQLMILFLMSLKIGFRFE
jgi:hypothetical protein